MKLTIKQKEIGSGVPLICVPVMEAKKEAILKEITYLAGSRADMIEWRVDAYENYMDIQSVREILFAAAAVLEKKIFLFTFRTKKQGGLAEPEEELLNNLQELAAESRCADFIDLEYFAEECAEQKIKRLQKSGAKIIASHHDFQKTPPPEEMEKLLAKMAESGADIVKLAVMPLNRKDVLHLLGATGEFKELHPDMPVITMSMGGVGSVSRLCGEIFGSCVTFGSHKKASAPGQFEMAGLADALEMIHESMHNLEI